MGSSSALTSRTRTVLESIPSTRGTHLRPERPAARHERRDLRASSCAQSDLPTEQRPTSLLGCPPSSAMSAADINATIDGNPGSTFDLVRLAGDVPEGTARLISEAGDQLPGVEVGCRSATSIHRQGPLHVAARRLHGSRLRQRSSRQLKAIGLSAGRSDRQGRRRGRIRGAASRDLRQSRASSRTPRVVRRRSSRPSHGATGRATR